ncbi:aminoacyl-tRNA hydrolase [uncultured Amaricoccus sp.]|mgnify:CR=1 FL=1|uniref:aminoacyl-tRNA hydrolase n=1 Tax=uncultured Amaricoccus sp. TaxID=339341 RepID=UPI0026347F63|nr:aminoacyl-tRNA hydrolase [uncultured Amaricoccus sp.]
MKLWVGLGNPGAQYARNRHNIGFMAVDAIADVHGFGPWRSKFQGQLAEGRVGGEKILLLKPETFMNLSGDSVRAALAFFKLAPGDVTVFHDELDLEAGRTRVKAGGGHAGHNGLRSIDAHIGPAFQRVRLGIGHPGDKRLVTNHVLGDFAKSDADWLDPLLTAVAKAAPALAAGDPSRFQSQLAPAPAPKPAKVARPAAETSQPEAAGGTPEPGAKSANAGPDAVEDPLSALRRLADRFR